MKKDLSYSNLKKTSMEMSWLKVWKTSFFHSVIINYLFLSMRTKLSYPTLQSSYPTVTAILECNLYLYWCLSVIFYMFDNSQFPPVSHSEISVQSVRSWWGHQCVNPLALYFIQCSIGLEKISFKKILINVLLSLKQAIE